MKELIKKLKPDCLENLIALVALFRPGPLQSGMVDDFINRKHGRAEISYPHSDYQYEGLKPVLAPTYGIILYQEQIGRAHVCTPVTNANLVCRLRLEKTQSTPLYIEHRHTIRQNT